MLSYTKKRELNCSHVNISDFTDEIVSVFKPKAVKQHVEFICEFDVSIIFFEIDPAALRSALINFLENAIDACEDNKNKNKKHKIIFTVRENKNNIFFEIKDNDIGMDTEIKDNMFTLFFSSKGHKGTGLGLFIANQTVEQHGGSIQVKSSLGKGSCFTLTLPKLLSKPK
ncbi:MAG: HAMP domain-containing histidine kinase [Deltaproteobacteria bacterium]|nr:HAMP domain-containing histidine kinase [Deltaproteobacteria bacterium]